MKDGPNFTELFEEFPELADPEAVFSKEVLAHYALLFAAYADLETGVQMCDLFSRLTISARNGEIQSESEWTTKHDALEAEAIAATFGNLLRRVATIKELDPHRSKLNELKKKRDYFAHHFFRSEVASFHSSEGLLGLMSAMHSLRVEVDMLSQEIARIHSGMLQSLFPAKDMDTEIRRDVERLKTDFHKNPPTSYGWESS